MKNLLSFFLFFSCIFTSEILGTDFINQVTPNSEIWGKGRFLNIDTYANGFAPFFVQIQSNGYFAMLCAIAIVAVITGFVGHYIIVGPKHFSHNNGKIYAFSKIERIVHLIAAISWMILVPTGIIMMFGKEFGGGFFVRLCKNLHDIATIAFILVIAPMGAFWFFRMLPRSYDIKWMMIVGGYLSKNKRPIPAGKFNAGQKAWFWVATMGGFAMIITGAAMFFLDFNIPILNDITKLSQIEILRLSVIIHNILGVICAVFLLVHIYMAVFAIKGSIHSVITGYKEEEEVYILHHYWYQELVKKGKIKPSKFEQIYTNLS